MRGFQIASLLAMAEGLPQAIREAGPPPTPSMASPLATAHRKANSSGTSECRCGRTISANKRQCRDCAAGANADREKQG